MTEPAGRAPSDHPELHRREVLGLVDDHVAVGRRVPLEQVARFVDQREIGGRPRRAARPPDRVLLLTVEDPVGTLGELLGIRQQIADECGRRHRWPHRVEHAAHHRIGLDRTRDVAWVRFEEAHASVHEVHESGAQRGAAELVRHTARDLLGHEHVDLVGFDRGALQPDPHDESVGQRSAPPLDRVRDHRRHARVALHQLRPRSDSTAFFFFASGSFTSGTRSASVTCNTASSPSDGSTCAM